MAFAVQLVEPGVRVRLQHPAEPRKMRLRMCNAGVIEILSQSSGVHLIRIRGRLNYRRGEFNQTVLS